MNRYRNSGTPSRRAKLIRMGVVRSRPAPVGASTGFGSTCSAPLPALLDVPLVGPPRTVSRLAAAVDQAMDGRALLPPVIPAGQRLGCLLAPVRDAAPGPGGGEIQQPVGRETVV